MSIDILVGKCLKRLRESSGMSQEEFAHQAGLHKNFIGMVERGQKSLTIRSLKKVVSVLNISMSDFLKKAEEF